MVGVTTILATGSFMTTGDIPAVVAVGGGGLTDWVIMVGLPVWATMAGLPPGPIIWGLAPWAIIAGLTPWPIILETLRH